MSADENLHPIQFHHEIEKSYDKADDLDDRGSDESGSYGYSDEDVPDYQYERYGKAETSTKEKREVF